MKKIKQLTDQDLKDAEAQILDKFEKFCAEYQGVGQDKVFIDLVDSMMYIGSLGKLQLEEYNRACKLYGSKELKEIIFEISEASEGFNDVLGEIYMHISSKYKSQSLGQYFTPNHIVDLGALILGIENNLEGAAMTDPAGCGSGRNILGMAKKVGQERYKHFFEGADVDLLCVKMCLVNCQMQTIPARVFHANPLEGTTWAVYDIKMMYYTLTKPAIYMGVITKLPQSEAEIAGKRFEFAEKPQAVRSFEKAKTSSQTTMF
jgi:type I restriction-modification system DNA methylase subunit